MIPLSGEWGWEKQKKIKNFYLFNLYGFEDTLTDGGFIYINMHIPYTTYECHKTYIKCTTLPTNVRTH